MRSLSDTCLLTCPPPPLPCTQVGGWAPAPHPGRITQGACNHPPLPNRKHHRAILNPSSIIPTCFFQRIEEPASCGPLLSKAPSYFQAKGMPRWSGRLSPPRHSAETQHRFASRKQDMRRGGYWEPCKFCSRTNRAPSWVCGLYALWQVTFLFMPASSFALCIRSSSGQEVLPQPSLTMMRTRRPVTSLSHNSPVPPNTGALSSLWVLPSGLFSALFCFKGSCLASLPPKVSHCRVAWQPALAQGHCWKHMPRGRRLALVTQRSAVMSTHSSAWI